MGRADQLPHIRDTSADLRRHLDTFSTPSSHLVVDTRDTLDTLSHVAQQLVTLVVDDANVLSRDARL